MNIPWLILLAVAIVVGVVILIAICGCYVCTNPKLFFRQKPSEEDEEGSQSMRSKKNTQSLVGTKDYSTLNTVDSKTGLPVNQMVGLSVKSQKSEQNSQKKSKTSPPKKTTKKVLPKN